MASVLAHEAERGRNIPDGIKRVGSETSTNGNTPTESEGSEERALERADEDNGLCIKYEHSGHATDDEYALRES